MTFEKWVDAEFAIDNDDTTFEYRIAKRAWTAATHECADILSINRSEAQLMAGEMTASEWRTVAAVLKWLQTQMRSNVKLRGAALLRRPA